MSTSSQHDTTTAARTKHDQWEEIWSIFDALDDDRKRQLADEATRLIAEQRAAKV